MSTDLIYCKNCGKFILSDYDDCYKLVQKTVKKGGILNLKKTVFYGEPSAFLIGENINGIIPQGTVAYVREDHKNHFTLCSDLYDFIQANDDYLYVSKKHLEKKDDIFGEYCPYCNAKLNHMEKLYDKGYLTFLDDDSGLEGFKEDINKMYKKRKQYLMKCNESLIEMFVNNIESNVDVDENFLIKSNVDIQQFLSNLINVETSIYSLKKRYLEVLAIENDKRYPAEYIKNNLKNEILDSLKIEKNNLQKSIKMYEDYFNVGEDTINFEKYGIYRPIKPIKPVEPSLSKPESPKYEKPGLFNKSKVEKRNNELKQKYEEEVSRYDLLWNEYRKNMNEFNTQSQVYPSLLFQYEDNIKTAIKREKELRENDIESKEKLSVLNEEYSKLEYKLNHLDETLEMELAKNPKVAAHNLCIQEIDMVKKTLTFALETRIKLHKLGVVHPKYLDYVCIATIYEYFETGRCDSLVGANGAYNIYENELRQNIIIDKLDVVIDSLEQIKKNQYMLYMQLQKVNDSLISMTNKMDDALRTLDQIEYNSAQTAYYSKINAQLTDALGYMIALKS